MIKVRTYIANNTEYLFEYIRVFRKFWIQQYKSGFYIREGSIG